MTDTGKVIAIRRRLFYYDNPRPGNRWDDRISDAFEDIRKIVEDS